mgnify:CR=1 FL=1
MITVQIELVRWKKKKGKSHGNNSTGILVTMYNFYDDEYCKKFDLFNVYKQMEKIHILKKNHIRHCMSSFVAGCNENCFTIAKILDKWSLVQF